MAVFNMLNNVCVLKLYSKNIHFILQGIKVSMVHKHEQLKLNLKRQPE